MAMVASEYGKTLTPDAACEWATKRGFAAPGNGTYYSYFPAAGREYGFEVTQLNGSDLRSMAAGQARTVHDAALKAVQNGHLVIACMGKGLWTSSGHFVVAWDGDGIHIKINDPNSTNPAREDASYSTFASQVKYYFVCKRPAAKELTTEEAAAIVRSRAGLEPETLEYLARDYKYGDALIKKLAAAMVVQATPNASVMAITDAKKLVRASAGLDDGTMAYLGCYRYSDPLISKLATAMRG
jgi:hypothetical protein